VGEQNFDFCVCPNCQQPSVNLEAGCSVCGWQPQELLGDKNLTPSKTRRQKGSGSGSIYWRTITRNGKDYRQAYYHWQLNGQKKTNYIPKQLLGVIEEAETKKLPVLEILKLLGIGQDLSPSNINPSNLLGDTTLTPSKSKQIKVEQDLSPSNINPSNLLGDTTLTPSKSKRLKGEGSGSIYWRLSQGKYAQAYYHYEIWDQGDRLIKSSRYIPKRLLNQVIALDQQKAPIKDILKLLGVKW
jgi:hypothetical protein